MNGVCRADPAPTRHRPASEPMKLACVIHRYGADIAGGSEAHCRLLAERLVARHDVTVLTSCARDYVTWRNAYPAGRSEVNGVTVVRFPVARERRLHRFAEISERVFAGLGSADDEIAWFRENGPDLPGLLEYLRQHGGEFDRVLFWSFRYAPAFFGLPLVADRAILVPTAEEDPAIRLEILEGYFALPRGFVFLTPEERDLVARRAGRPLSPSVIVGMGLDPAPARSDPRVLDRFDLARPFLLYLGRVERNKGCDTLLRFFGDYAASGRPRTQLVLAGPPLMQIPSHPDIRALGFVSNEVREALLAEARALVVPSPYESLSIVLLEGWNHGLPALVNAKCRVLTGQVIRADGGLYYETTAEFAEALDWLIGHAPEATCLGAQGRAYVEREYRWPTVLGRIEEFLGAV